MLALICAGQEKVISSRSECTMGLTEGASSSSGGGISLGAGGAKSHAYIQYPPLRCDIPGAAGVMYDDGNKLLLVPAPNKVILPHID